jgi:hypothetical protein
MHPFTFDPSNARIALAHRRLRDAYARVPGAEVPIVDPAPRTAGTRYSVLECYNDFTKMAANAVAWAEGMAATDNDWPPFIDTFCGVVMIAEVFGCPVEWESDVAWTKPILTDISQAWDLTPRPLATSPMVKRLADWVDYAQREIGTDLPLWTMDVQSPFSVAAHLIDAQELMMACYTDPDAVHHLCRMITDVSIAQMQAHIAQMEHPGFPGRNFPSISDRIGICIADDTPLVMLSPEMYREFALPYNAEVGAALGGIHIHSCGNYRPTLDALLETPGLRSIQLHAGVGEFPLPATADADDPFNRARTRLTYLVDSNPISVGDAFTGKMQDHYTAYVLPRLTNTDRTGLILQSCGTSGTLPTTDEAIAWTRAGILAGAPASSPAR